MNKYKYTILSKFLYRYLNIPLSFAFLTYFFVSIFGIPENRYLIITAIINLFLLVAINKLFIKTYKGLPFVIKIDKEKIIASDFMFTKKCVEIKYEDIDRIAGGVFGYNPKGQIYIHDGKQQIEISIHPSMDNVNDLLKIVLSSVNQDISRELVQKLKRQDVK